MTTFDERERSYEKKFMMDEELKFKAESRRNRFLGQWAAAQLGLTGSAQGGGIFDAAVPNGPPGGPLVLTNSTVTHNGLTGGAAITLQGGGVFARNPVTLTHSVIAGNTPDQCDGCR